MKHDDSRKLEAPLSVERSNKKCMVLLLAAVYRADIE